MDMLVLENNEYKPTRKISQSSGAKPFPIRGDRTANWVNLPHVIGN